MAEYPLHWLVWHNKHSDLDTELDRGIHDIEKLDPRGRTPLMLSVTLGHLESAKILLKHNANVNVENKNGYSVVHEAVSTGDPEMVQCVIERRDYQRHTSRVNGIPELLNRLKDTPDFYVEMKWEFTSWVPLISRMCPSDTYKVYKNGSSVRIDTTLLGFDQTSWQRGNRSYIFQGHNDTASMIEIDHDAQQSYTELITSVNSRVNDISFMRPTPEVVSARLTAPIATTYLDTEKISFERSKAGIWGWRSDRNELVNNYDCKVFGANSVELVTKQRTEHLCELDKLKTRTPKSPLQSFLGIAEVEEKSSNPSVDQEAVSSQGNPCNITSEEYFNPEIDLKDRDIGRPKEVTTKIQKFKANLWLCENYPLSLPEQIMPIVDLMAMSSSHFAKLKDFITLQLPSGFPVKIEIPLFHVLNARITFGNIFSLDEAVEGVTVINDENCAVACVLDESCFNIPGGYIQLGNENRRQFSVEEDDELLQFAIQQSLLESGNENDQVTIWEALQSEHPRQNVEERELQRVIQESLAVQDQSTTPAATNSLLSSDHVDFMNISANSLHPDSQLRLALELSEKEKMLAEKRQKEEDELLEEVLKLSLQEK